MTVDYKTIPEEQFDDKYKLALSKSDMPDVVTKMYIKPYDILGYANKGVFLPLEDYIEKNMPNLKKVLVQGRKYAPPSHLRTGIFIHCRLLMSGLQTARKISM